MSRPPEPLARRGRGRGRGATRGSPSPSGLTTRESAPGHGVEAVSREARASAVKERQSLGTREKKKPGTEIYVPRARRLHQEQVSSVTQPDSQRDSDAHSLPEQHQVDDRLRCEPCDPWYRGQGDTTPIGHGDVPMKCQSDKTSRSQTDINEKGLRKDATESPRGERHAKVSRKLRPEIQRYVPRARRQPQSDTPIEQPVTPETWDERVECNAENRSTQEKLTESPKGSSVKKLRCDTGPDGSGRMSESGERRDGINLSNHETQESVDKSSGSNYSSANGPCVQSTVPEPSSEHGLLPDLVQGAHTEISEEHSQGLATQVTDSAHSVSDKINDANSIDGSCINDVCASSLGSEHGSFSESDGTTTESSVSDRHGCKSREKVNTECTESQEDGHVDHIPASPMSQSTVQSNTTPSCVDDTATVDVVSAIPVVSDDSPSQASVEPDVCMLVQDSNPLADSETFSQNQNSSTPDGTSVGKMEVQISGQDDGCVHQEKTETTKVEGEGHSEDCDIQMEVDSSNQQMNGVASEVNERHQDGPKTATDVEESETSHDHAEVGVPDCRQDSQEIKKQLKEQALAALDSEIRRRSEDAESLAVERQLKAEAIAAENFADPPSNSQEEDEDSWDKMFDDNGDCLDPSAMEELTAHVGNVKIDKPKINYLDFKPKDPDMDMNMYGHVIEIYDFPGEFLTRDLIAAFKDYMSRGFDIKWVDDTHALGVFASPIAAQDALSNRHPMLKVRSLSEASRQSKVKAKKNCEFLQPYKARPQTSASAARRLVSGALGLQSQIPREKREQERKQLKEAKEKRRKERRLKQDIWDGSIGGCAMDKEG
ncbi:coiled-coil domain-containing protein R3HCC1L-like [Haliotis asinina]|uniref:coiled-coil domain-containing protein R3HCC1L-like n=1 Tax=Haliotis asinina TaxID=109174 RepID=UPI00353267D5